MTVRKLSQKSFVSGQYDRAAQNQESYTQGGIVATGLSYAKNVLSSDKGELRKRLGTKYIKELSSPTVIVPFRMPNEDDVAFLLDNNQITGIEYKDGIPKALEVVTGAAPTFPTSGWSSTNTNGGYTVRCSSSTSASEWGQGFNSVDWHQARPYTPKYPYGTHYVSGSHTGANEPAWISIESTNPQLLGKVSIMWLNKSDGNHPGHYKGWINPILQYSDDGNTWTSVRTGVWNVSNAVQNIPGVYHGNWVHNGITESTTGYRVENIVHDQPHKYWRIYFTDKIYNNNTYGSEQLSFFCYNVNYLSTNKTEYVDYYTASDLKRIKYAQNEQTLALVCKDTTPIKITYSGGTFTKADITAVSTWGAPSCVEYFQNRLWFSGFDTIPTSVLASKFGDYENFTQQATPQFDDYLNLKCNQLKSSITNIRAGQKVLYCFSEDGISMIDGKSNGWSAVNSQNIEFILRNRMPAGDATPAFRDDVMLYSSSDGTKLYGVDYDLLVERFQVSDLAKYAKDITKAKITELHYLNNEAKLVYGLTEEDTMFALLYEKGQYQGFFPLDFGGQVYDICPIKVGRDYKLLMVVFRNGRWYLEEKLDLGNYIDTSKIRMTAEEKKWATYDNLENNIALDCYQTYDESFSANVVINGTVADTRYDLSAYIGKSVMFGQMNDSKVWCLATIDGIATENKNMRKMRTNVTPYKYAYIASDVEENQPNIPVYDENGKYLTFGIYNGSILLAYENGAYEIYENELTPVFVDMDIEIGYQLTIADTRGTANAYDTICPEFTVFQPNLPQTANIAVISEGRYFDAQHPDNSGNLQLPLPCHKLTYGVVYEALAVIKLQTPYESMKEVVQVDVSLIDTTHLEIGTDLSDTLTIETINDSSYYDLTAITINDTCRVVVGDTPEMTKKVMFRSNKGVPFTINAVEVYVNYSNLGGN